MKVHHNTIKRAKKFGIELRVVENEIEAYRNGVMLASGMSGTVVLDKAIAKLDAQAPKPVKAKAARKPRRKADEADEGEDEGEVEADEDGGEGDEDAGKSIVKRKYKQAYRPFKHTCGDDLSQLITKHLKVVDDETGEERIDEDRLARFAKANDVWVSDYRNLNVGMRRMNIANRLRAKVRKGHKIVWAS